MTKNTAAILGACAGVLSLLAAAAAQTPLQLQPFVAGLTRPLLVTAPAGDLHRVFVVEQPGRIRIVRDGVLLAAPFLDLASLGIVSFGGEAGLLGLAFHPGFATNGQFFVYYIGNPWPLAVVSRYTVSAGNPDAADPTSGAIVLTQSLVYGNHNGGMIEFGPDGYLYVGIGDGGSNPPSWPDDPFNHAQRGDSLLGKLLRIDVDNPAPPLAYGIPAGNPFAAPGLPRDEIWALGLRNPWRFSFDRLLGDLYLADVGGLREEIDFEAAGASGGRNYGWACMSGTVCNGLPVCACNSPALTPPIHDYTFPTPRAVIGGYVYRGCAIPDLRGTYFFGDFSQRRIWSFRQVGGGVTQFTDRTVELTPAAPLVLGSILSFGQDAYGELYVCDLLGSVYKIVPNGPVLVGLQPYGIGTPGCNGAHALAAACSAVVGNPAFELRCSHGPANSPGVMVIASHADVAGTNVGLGFLAHVQVTSPLLLLNTVFSDAAGVGRFAFGIPGTPALAGFTLHAQALWPWHAAVCTPSPSGWSSSPGLSITLQP